MSLEIKNPKFVPYLNLEETLEPVLKSDEGAYVFELDKNGMDFLESLTHDGKDASMWLSHRLVGKVSQICEGFLPFDSVGKMKLHVTSDVEPKVTIKGIQVKTYNIHKGLHGTYKFGDHFFEIRDGTLFNIDPITKKDFLWAHCGIQI